MGGWDIAKVGETNNDSKIQTVVSYLWPLQGAKRGCGEKEDAFLDCVEGNRG